MCNPLSSHKFNWFAFFNSVSRNWPRTQKNSHMIKYLSFQPLQFHLYNKSILLIYYANSESSPSRRIQILLRRPMRISFSFSITECNMSNNLWIRRPTITDTDLLLTPGHGMPGTENRVKSLVVHRKEILKLACSHPRSSISNCMFSHGGLSNQSRISTLLKYRQNQESPFEPESLNTEGCRSLLGKAQIVKVMRVASDEVDVHLYRASANNCARKISCYHL